MRAYVIFIAIILQLINPVVPATSSTFVWGYGSDNGPSKWGQYYPICLGKRQSPINIDSPRTTFNPKLEHIQASHYISPQPNIKTTLTNIGKSIFIQPAIDYSPVLVDPLNSGVFYRAHHLHFHWGASDNYGSENAIDNKYYPIEIHIVHYNIKYQNVLQAIPKPDGLAVIGIFVKIGEGSAGFSWLSQYMQKLQYKDETVTANGFSYSSFLPKDMSKYFTFPGSLTTPLCEESVRWIVMEEPITISSQQMNQFRKLYATARNKSSSKYIDKNYRPVQPLNNRIVYSSFDTNAYTNTIIIVFGSIFAVVIVAIGAIVAVYGNMMKS